MTKSCTDYACFMAIAAYIYLDPLLHDQPPEPDAWGTPVDRVYQDLQQNLSSESQQEPTLEATRPALTQFLTDAGSVAPNPPAFECLLVQRLEDLGDSLTEVAAVLDQLANLGVQLQVADQAVSLDSTVQARSNLLKLLQTCQTQQRSRRLRQGHARNRLQALPPPGRAPYGYRRGKEAYVIDRTTAPVVKEFFEHFILYGYLGGAVRQIAKRYNKNIS
ncbi:MAG: recombinase family protein, partial [Cyanobacteria bacterium P01_H01_bin.121]